MISGPEISHLGSSSAARRNLSNNDELIEAYYNQYVRQIQYHNKSRTYSIGSGGVNEDVNNAQDEAGFCMQCLCCWQVQRRCTVFGAIELIYWSPLLLYVVVYQTTGFRLHDSHFGDPGNVAAVFVGLLTFCASTDFLLGIILIVAAKKNMKILTVLHTCFGTMQVFLLTTLCIMANYIVSDNDNSGVETTAYTVLFLFSAMRSMVFAVGSYGLYLHITDSSALRKQLEMLRQRKERLDLRPAKS